MAEFTLRAFCLIDRMQPQFAAFEGTVMSGDIPLEGMAELFIEIGPGNEVYRLLDVALKASGARPGSQVVEREYGMLELHSFDPEEVNAAGAAILERAGLEETDRLAPRVASEQLITRLDPYQTQLFNRRRRGSMMVPGETLWVLEVEPAAYVCLAANEAEKAAEISIAEIASVGRFGRLWITGTEAQAAAARGAALAALGALQGRRESS